MASAVSVSSLESVAVGARGGLVGDRAGVEVGLGDGGARGAGDGLAQVEEAVEVAHGVDVGAELVGGDVVVDGDRARDRDVAAVGDQEAVAQDVAHAVVGSPAVIVLSSVRAGAGIRFRTLLTVTVTLEPPGEFATMPSLFVVPELSEYVTAPNE